MLIKPASLGGTLAPVASKSHLIRLLLASMLAGEEVVIDNYTPSMDVDATLSCLEQLGLSHEVQGRTLRLRPQDRVERPRLSVGESGTLLRLILPILAALGVTAEVDARPSLRARPVQTALELLTKHGVALNRGYPIAMTGKLQAGTYYVDVSMSSQFLSGFLMALPLLDEDSRIRLVGRPVSVGYVQMTLDVMSLFGIKVTPTMDGFVVWGHQTYRAPQRIRCEGDWSSAAFWVTAGALYSPVRLKGLDIGSTHNDKNIVEIVSQAGAKTRWDEGDLVVEPGDLVAIDRDLRYTPDLAPVVAVLCALSRGESHLSGVRNLKVKECDRLSAILSNLTAAGIETYYSEETDCLTIVGGDPAPSRLLGFNDHRMAMSAAILLAKKGGELTDPDAVAKSYPGFWKDYVALGGSICD